METPAAETTPTPVVAAPPAPIAAAPVPLTAVPAVEGAEATAEAPRVKRKYTKRADKAAAPKKAPTMKKAKAKRVAKTAKAPKEKKARRVAGTKAQGQVPKPVFRFLKTAAKEAGTSVGSLVGEILTDYSTRRGLKLDA